VSGGESKRGGGDVASEQVWQRRRRLVDERWQREAALKAESESKSLEYGATRRDAERECERIRAELVRLEAAWQSFYERYPASYGNRLFSERIGDDERALAELMVRLAEDDGFIQTERRRA